MTRNEVARILRTEMAFDRRFEKVTRLRRDRQHERYNDEHGGETKSGKPADDQARHGAGDRAAERAGPGLVRADRDPEFWSSDGAAGEIGRDVGDPHDR